MKQLASLLTLERWAPRSRMRGIFIVIPAKAGIQKEKSILPGCPLVGGYGWIPAYAETSLDSCLRRNDPYTPAFGSNCFALPTGGTPFGRIAFLSIRLFHDVELISFAGRANSESGFPNRSVFVGGMLLFQFGQLGRPLIRQEFQD